MSTNLLGQEDPASIAFFKKLDELELFVPVVENVMSLLAGHLREFVKISD